MTARLPRAPTQTPRCQRMSWPTIQPLQPFYVVVGMLVRLAQSTQLKCPSLRWGNWNLGFGTCKLLTTFFCKVKSHRPVDQASSCAEPATFTAHLLPLQCSQRLTVAVAGGPWSSCEHRHPQVRRSAHSLWQLAIGVMLWCCRHGALNDHPAQLPACLRAYSPRTPLDLRK